MGIFRNKLFIALLADILMLHCTFISGIVWVVKHGQKSRASCKGPIDLKVSVHQKLYTVIQRDHETEHLITSLSWTNIKKTWKAIARKCCHHNIVQDLWKFWCCLEFMTASALCEKSVSRKNAYNFLPGRLAFFVCTISNTSCTQSKTTKMFH